MITFKQFRQRLSRSIDEQADVCDLFEECLNLLEDSTFYLYRTDTNAVLARGIQGYQTAKEQATLLRQRLGLKWDQVKFKMERDTKRTTGAGAQSTPSSRPAGVTRRMDYAPRFNPSKGRRFRGYYDQDGGYHDLD
jgi:hypothetical protein